MSIEIHCESCQKRYRVKADLAGKRVRCASCGSPVLVPNGQNGSEELHSAPEMTEIPNQPRRPMPPKAAPPPVPKQVVRFDPRFDPQASDLPTPPPPPAAPKPPQRTPQPARKNQNEGGQELRFVADDPLFMSTPKSSTYDDLGDT